MNIELIKQFINIREELKSTGVIGISVHTDEVQVRTEVLTKMDNLQVEVNDLESKYPYEVFTDVDGIKIYAICTGEELERLFPQFKGYLIEDVDLSGSEMIS